MSYPISFYADEYGTAYGASETNESGAITWTNRFVGSLPVEWAGMWYPTQLEYRPFGRAIAKAAKLAKHRANLIRRLEAYAAKKSAKLGSEAK